jgi:hypothetical protein
MISAACFLPHPPLLLAEYASLADPAAELRDRCRIALAELAATGPEHLVVLTGADRVASPTSSRSPLGLRVARELLADTAGLPVPGELTVSFDAGTSELTAAATHLRTCAAGRATGVLVLGDGSARRGEKAPGYLDERSSFFDSVVTDALAAGDPEPLRKLDADLAAELLVAGRAAWQVLATAVDGPADVVSAYSADPFGVLYHLAVWQWEGRSGGNN